MKVYYLPPLLRAKLLSKGTQLARMPVFILIFLIFQGSSLSAQETTNQKRLKSIDTEINKAVETENYQKAAELKKEKKLRQELEEAVKSENYAKAAEVKQQLKSGGAGASARITALEKELKAAIDKEDYVKAGELKKQIDALKAGKEPAPAKSEPTKQVQSDAEPEFVNQVYRKASDGSLHSLEKADGQLKTSGGGFGGYASATSSYMIPGSKSPIRLKKDQLSFVVKTFPGVDPSEHIKLVKMEIRGRKQDRYADAYKSTAAMYHSETGEVTGNQVNISFKSIEDAVYQIVVEDDLAPGEYSFMYITKMFAFGID